MAPLIALRSGEPPTERPSCDLMSTSMAWGSWVKIRKAPTGEHEAALPCCVAAKNSAAGTNAAASAVGTAKEASAALVLTTSLLLCKLHTPTLKEEPSEAVVPVPRPCRAARCRGGRLLPISAASALARAADSSAHMPMCAGKPGVPALLFALRAHRQANKPYTLKRALASDKDKRCRASHQVVSFDSFAAPHNSALDLLALLCRQADHRGVVVV